MHLQKEFVDHEKRNLQEKNLALIKTNKRHDEEIDRLKKELAQIKKDFGKLQNKGRRELTNRNKRTGTVESALKKAEQNFQKQTNKLKKSLQQVGTLYIEQEHIYRTSSNL